MSTLPSGRCGV
jgi:hypothetical protein